MSKITIDSTEHFFPGRTHARETAFMEIRRGDLIDAIFYAIDKEDNKMGDLLTKLYLQLLNEEDHIKASLNSIKIPMANAVQIIQYLNNVLD